MVRTYTRKPKPIATPQTQPIPGRETEMVQNNAGGFGFVLDKWERLHRFLIMGSEGGTYYVGEEKLTEQNAANAISCIKEDGPRVVATALDVNVNNRAPKTDQQLFLLALAMKHGNDATKKAVATAAPLMLRTGTHVLHFAAILDSMGGWSRAKRRLIARWFSDREADKLAFQVLKYRQRDGWSMRDLLRVAHPAAPTPAHAAVYQWLCGRPLNLEQGLNLPLLLGTFENMKTIEGDDKKRSLFGIQHGVPREALPTEALADPAVWRALLPKTPPHALVRNLGVLTANGTLTQGGDDTALVVQRLTDKDALRQARVHPFAILLASLVYQGGKGIRGSKTWAPVRSIIEALDDAYETAFDNVQPTGKRILVAIDGSGSMSAACQGTPITCQQAADAIALTLARTEPNAKVVVFETEVRKTLTITKRSALSTISYTRNPSGTDLSAPIRWALSSKEVYDAFILISDNETWAGRVHPTQMLADYRSKKNPRAKLVCCSMEANHANVVDPQDAGQLGFAGLDANLPALVADFIGR